MSDIFTKSNAFNLLKGSSILFLGDSNTRAQYKDLIWLLSCGTLIEIHALRRKLECSFLGDTLIKRSELNRGRDFQEIRKYECDGVSLEYHFITRCYNESIVKLISSFKSGTNLVPDIVYINSCLWDISRWGPNGVSEYKDNMVKLMKLFKKCLPRSTLIIWGTTLPIASQIRGGLLIKQVEFLQHTLRFDVMEANMFARQLVVAHGYDVLDQHYYMRMQIHRRVQDGVHYTELPVRYMTNLILTHIALSWGRELPGTWRGGLLEKTVNQKEAKANNKPVILPSLPSGQQQGSSTSQHYPQRSLLDAKGNQTTRKTTAMTLRSSSMQNEVRIKSEVHVLPRHKEEEKKKLHSTADHSKRLQDQPRCGRKNRKGGRENARYWGMPVNQSDYVPSEHRFDDVHRRVTRSDRARGTNRQFYHYHPYYSTRY